MVLISGSVWAQEAPQQNSKEFYAIVKVEDAEKFYNGMEVKNPEYRAQLAVDWLINGNIEKYKFYKTTNTKLTPLQLFELSNQLEYWVDDNKHLAEVEQISKQLIEEIEKKLHSDIFGRMGVLLEVNAVANAKLGKVDLAMKTIESSNEKAGPFRSMAYFRNSKANYLNRYAVILAAAGQYQRALDTLDKAVREANSTAKTSETLKTVYQKVKKATKAEADKYVSSLQDEAYHKIYKEVEKAWFAEPKPLPNVPLWDMNGKEVKLADYKGKIVVIDFWSTACKPCVAAFPAFERAVDLYKNEPFRLFVIDIGETPEIVRPYIAKKGYELDILFDKDEAIFKALDAIGTPQKFIIDANGNINQTGIGYAGSDDKEFYKLKAMVELTKARSNNEQKK